MGTSWRARLIVAACCLVLGFLMVLQFRSQRIDHSLVNQSPNDQASYISQLYSSNQNQSTSLEQLRSEIARYQASRTGGASSLTALIKDLQKLRMINGAVDLVGLGVQVRVTGDQSIIQVLQDLVNELRNAGAEAIAVNGVRLVTRSVLTEDIDHHVLVDTQMIGSPYRLEAIGDPATLQTALERKGGVIALWQEAQGDKLEIKVARRSDDKTPIKLPKTALDPKWRYAHPIVSANPAGN